MSTCEHSWLTSGSDDFDCGDWILYVVRSASRVLSVRSAHIWVRSSVNELQVDVVPYMVESVTTAWCPVHIAYT